MTQSSDIRSAVAEKVEKCTVRDGRFVDPCWGMSESVDNIAPGFSAAKGIARWTYTNWETHQPSRTFFGIKSGTYPKGMAFNFCPWCGTEISAPFTSDEDKAA